MSNKTLLIGASGLLGKHLELNDTVLCPAHKELDITNYDNCKEYINSYNLNKIVLCAAFTKVSKSNIEKEKVYKTNIEGVHNIISIIKNNDIRLYFISTDYVFDGRDGFYKVTDKINPVANNYYAFSKAIGETLVSTLNKYTIIRTSFCDENYWPYSAAFIDQWTSRDKVSIIAPLISQEINNIDIGNKNIVHIGTKRKSVFDLAKSIDPNVKSITRNELNIINLPFDTSLVRGALRYA